MESRIFTSLENGEYEREFRTRLGIMVIKPDAVQLGIGEELIYYITTKLYESNAGVLNGAYIVQINRDYIPSLYPNLGREVGEIVRDYLSEDISIIATFKGNRSQDIWGELHQMKGTRLMDRSEEQLNQPMGIKTGIRDIIPVPSTRNRFQEAFEKLKLRIIDKTIPFTDPEYKVYCRNLIHTPDDLREGIALLNILDRDQIKENIPLSEFVRATKQPETRRRRIEVACSKLTAGTRRPCCFNRSACTVPEVSQNGVLINKD